jgi:hypothetical protein
MIVYRSANPPLAAELGSILFHHVPDHSLGDAITPTLPGLADAPKQSPAAEFSRTDPRVYRCFDPVRHWHSSRVPALTDQIDYRPVSLQLLQVRELKIRQLAPAKAATNHSEHCTVPFTLECAEIRHLPEPAGLLSVEPVSKPHTQLLVSIRAHTCRSNCVSTAEMNRSAGARMLAFPRITSLCYGRHRAKRPA